MPHHPSSCHIIHPSPCAPSRSSPCRRRVWRDGAPPTCVHACIHRRAHACMHRPVLPIHPSHTSLMHVYMHACLAAAPIACHPVDCMRMLHVCMHAHAHG
jgi:hypothetical protein